MYVSVWVWDVSICVEDRGLAFSWVCGDQMSILGVFLCCHLLYFNERLDPSLNLVPVTVGRLTEWPATSLNWLNMRLPHTGLLSGFYLSNHRVSDFIKKYFIHLSISTCPFLILLEHFFLNSRFHQYYSVSVHFYCDEYSIKIFSWIFIIHCLLKVHFIFILLFVFLLKAVVNLYMLHDLFD